MNITPKQKVGSLGEELVAKFLMKQGYKVLDRNYRRPWGELDVVAERKGKIHFVEVKALSQNIVSDETAKTVSKSAVSSETSGRESALKYVQSKVRKDRFRPEDNVNSNKTKRLGRIIQTYLMEKHVSDETDWQFDVATVLIDGETKRAKINFIEGLIL